MIGSLLNLTANKPNILFVVCLCARFQINPKEPHMSALKWIFAYLKDSSDCDIFYSKHSDFSLRVYTDVDFGGSKTNRKNTNGPCQFLGHSLISRFSKKQSTVALSTTEAEYIAIGSSVKPSTN